MTIKSLLSRYRVECLAHQSRRVLPTSQPLRNAQRGKAPSTFVQPHDNSVSCSRSQCRAPNPIAHFLSADLIDLPNRIHMQRISTQLLVTHAATCTPQHKQASTRRQPERVMNDSKQAQTGHRSHELFTFRRPRTHTSEAHNGRRAQRCLSVSHQPVLTFTLPVEMLGTSSSPGHSQPANHI